MAKSSSKSKSAERPPTTKKIDAALASLFESSLGVVKAPVQKTYVAEKKDAPAAAAAAADEGSGDEEELSEVEEDAQSSDDGANTTTDRSRKRKRKAAEEDLEDSYMRKLAEDEPKPKSKKSKSDKSAAVEEEEEEEEEEVAEGSGAEDDSDEEEEETMPTPDPNFPIKHHSLVLESDIALDKSARTVFLGNVPSNAISSKTDYKKLKTFFSTAGKISSVRFRSIAFSEQIPRKAAFVNHRLHEKQKTVNCYVVYTDVAAAREALKLNGSIVLDRHIRVDSIAHPGKQEHRQCIFVGNLDFEAQEENLWRHFGPCGKIEYVRVVRDPKTNVGKGFAYVQFVDAMSVEQALLLDGKKMEGDRKLRITRAKAIKRNAKPKNPAERQRRAVPKEGRQYVPKVDPKAQATVGRAGKLLGRAGASVFKKQVEVFEGLRATADTDSGVKKGGTGKKKGGKARARTTTRSTAWKKKA